MFIMTRVAAMRGKVCRAVHSRFVCPTLGFSRAYATTMKEHASLFISCMHTMLTRVLLGVTTLAVAAGGVVM